MLKSNTLQHRDLGKEAGKGPSSQAKGEKGDFPGSESLK